MVKLVKLAVSLACLAGFVWFGMSVDLGERTFFQHMRAIGESDESQELWRGASQKVGGVLGAEKDEAVKPPSRSVEIISEAQAARAAERARGKGPAQDDLTDSDRRDMRRLIQSQARAEKIR